MAITGTVKLVGYNFVPRGFSECNGQLLSIASNTALFSLLGTTFGGDGRSTFGLPDMAGRAPVHVGPVNQLGQHGGHVSVTLDLDTMAQHTHPLYATEAVADQTDPTGNMLATGSPRGTPSYVSLGSHTKVNMDEHAMSETGGGQAHTNFQPYQAVKYVIALYGVYPSRSAGFLSDDEEDYLGDIRPMAYNFAPRGWAQCNGQLLDIGSNQSLYSLLGTMYGGDGRKTFALPDLRGRVPIDSGTRDGVDFVQGQSGGTEGVALTSQEIPPHFHQVELAETDATTASPDANMLAGNAPIYTGGDRSATMAASQVGTPAGAGAAHENMMPFETVNFCICTQGLFPSRN
ncbi:phage tail protein [uncultured Roseovarius sp.]|uniref:phage tail protein n=1 Tax=uncultured Roseovarius sp. TaxID=293344 RepID=UPI00260C514C|nr:tail fiber protein [uncultured Roseovarius sp.]